MRIVFFGTSNVALPVLEELIKRNEVLAVVTTPDVKAGRDGNFSESPVSALAKDLKLPMHKPDRLKGNEDFFGVLKNLGADIFVVVSYGKILPLEIIEMPKFKTVNVHFSILPAYRGPSPVQFALLDGQEFTGASIFLLEEKVDTGPLIWQKVEKIQADDNFITLADRLARMSAGEINQVLSDYAQGKITPLPQDEASATYTKIITRQDGQVDFNKTASEIYNQFRAFYPWPGIWTRWQGKIFKILDCSPAQHSGYSGNSGKVLEGGIVACGQQTFLKLRQVQLEGKTETDIESFINGRRDFVGATLGE